MLAYEEALEKTRALVPEINTCLEYKDAYVFLVKHLDSGEGGYGQVVIDKATGGVLNYSEYIQRSRLEYIRTICVNGISALESMPRDFEADPRLPGFFDDFGGCGIIPIGE